MIEPIVNQYIRHTVFTCEECGGQEEQTVVMSENEWGMSMPESRQMQTVTLRIGNDGWKSALVHTNGTCAKNWLMKNVP